MVTGQPIKPNMQTWFKVNQYTASIWIHYTGYIIMWFKVNQNKCPSYSLLFTKFERVALWGHTPKLRENWNPLG